MLKKLLLSPGIFAFVVAAIAIGQSPDPDLVPDPNLYVGASALVFDEATSGYITPPGQSAPKFTAGIPGVSLGNMIEVTDLTVAAVLPNGSKFYIGYVVRPLYESDFAAEVAEIATQISTPVFIDDSLMEGGREPLWLSATDMFNGHSTPPHLASQLPNLSTVPGTTGSGSTAITILPPCSAESAILAIVPEATINEWNQSPLGVPKGYGCVFQIGVVTTNGGGTEVVQYNLTNAVALIIVPGERIMLQSAGRNYGTRNDTLHFSGTNMVSGFSVAFPNGLGGEIAVNATVIDDQNATVKIPAGVDTGLMRIYPHTQWMPLPELLPFVRIIGTIALTPGAAAYQTSSIGGQTVIGASWKLAIGGTQANLSLAYPTLPPGATGANLVLRLNAYDSAVDQAGLDELGTGALAFSGIVTTGTIPQTFVPSFGASFTPSLGVAATEIALPNAAGPHTASIAAPPGISTEALIVAYWVPIFP